jgi:hypothetical protein
VLKRFELGGQPALVQRHSGHDQALALVVNEEKDTCELVLISEKGVQSRFDLGTRFDAVAQSDDGRYAVVHFAPNGDNSQTSSLLFNPNEIAIVDLEGDPDTAVVKRTLRSYGAGPRSVQFSPPMELAGETRRLMAVSFGAQLSLLDLNYPQRPEYTIELSGSASVNLRQLTFSVEDQKLYLLAQGSNDVFVVRLLPAGENRENDFEPSLNQLGSDAVPQDMVVFESSEGTRLLVASGDRVQVVEASSSRVTQVPLTTQAGRILLFEGSSPFDDETEPRALLYAAGQSSVSFIDLEAVEERTTRNVERLAVPGGISELVPLDDERVLITHASQGFTILDLQARTASPIQARIGLQSVVPSLETGRLWVAPNGASTLGFVDLESLHPGQVQLDHDAQGLFVFNQTEPPRVVVNHDAPEGRISILDAADPADTERAVTLQGFFLEGVLDR